MNDLRGCACRHKRPYSQTGGERSGDALGHIVTGGKPKPGDKKKPMGKPFPGAAPPFGKKDDKPKKKGK
jgi:hypothetical protein